ncbi:MAG: glycosyltransferase [Thaumarchaeota archaeon]|nr:glycosyltransferase [Nitrososphaerota archaeon]
MSRKEEVYDEGYYENYYDKYSGTRPYTRENFLPFFKEIANRIVKEFSPKTVLDAGCAMGYLVESLRDLGIEAYGFDISDYAINQARTNIRKYVKKQSILDPIDKQYDLIVCIEVLEHLPEQMMERAIENLCQNTSAILFSSTPDDKTEPTHQNVQDPGYWASHFAKFGFIEQVNHDVSYVAPHAMFFKKVENKQNLDIIKSYSNGVYSLKNSLLELRSLNHERLLIINDLQGKLQQRDNQLKELANTLQQRDNQDYDLVNIIQKRENQIKQYAESLELLQKSIRSMTESIVFVTVIKFSDYWNKHFPPKSRKRKYADVLMLKILGILGINPNESRTELKTTESIKLSSLSIDMQYKLWLENHKISDKEINLIKKEISKFKIKPKISIIMPVYNVDKIWLEAAIDSVRKQLYENWELCIVDDASSKNSVKSVLEEYRKLDERIKVQYLSKNLGIAGASNKAIELSTGDYVGFLDNDDYLYSDALFEIVKRINEKPDVELLYSDEDKIDANGQRIDPYFKPDWSPDLLMTGNYITHFCVFHNLLIKSLKGFRLGYDGSQDFDLFLRATDIPRKIEHIPKVLYGWRQIPGSASVSVHSKPYAYSASLRALQDALDRRSIKGKVEQVPDTLHFRVRYDFGIPLVSIILIAQNDVDFLKKCISSIESTNYKNFELIIVDNSYSKEIKNFLNSSNHKIISVDTKSNISRIYNAGAYHAKGDLLLFLNGTVEPLSSDWLESMLESISVDVGVVGPMLITSYNSPTDRFIVNAGTVIGVGGIASNAFAGLLIPIMYYRNVHLTIRNCSAVTRNCMLIKKKIFDKVGGWDEKIQQYNDVDLCLRVADKGYKIVYTPYAKLLQHKTNTSIFLDDYFFVANWKQKINNPDPFYNVNLSQTSASYGISPYSNFPRPLAILMEVYLNREDLQNKFPEAKSGNFRNLLQWTLESGIKDDVSFYILRPFENEFEQLFNRLDENGCVY